MPLSRKQTGFTLVEVLVALVLVAIGLLGLANLQTVGLRNHTSTYLTAQAIWLANDITDRIRSNSRTANYSNITPQQFNCSDPQNPCTPQQMAANDLWEWKQNIIRTLGSNAVTLVCIDDNPFDNRDCVAGGGNSVGDPFMVRITWDDPVQGNGTQQLVTFFIR